MMAYIVSWYTVYLQQQVLSISLKFKILTYFDICIIPAVFSCKVTAVDFSNKLITTSKMIQFLLYNGSKWIFYWGMRQRIY